MAKKKSAKKADVKRSATARNNKKPAPQKKASNGNKAKKPAKASVSKALTKKTLTKSASGNSKSKSLKSSAVKAARPAKNDTKAAAKPARKATANATAKASKQAPKKTAPSEQAKAEKPVAQDQLANGVNSEGQPVKRRKSSRKPLISLPPPPKIDVSNYPKNKVKSIMVSQPKPADPDKNPYVILARKYNLSLTFRHFIRVEGLSAQDFRAQRIDILEHGAVILTSKLSVDHYFKMCNEMRVTVPETMKYFCINEQTAYYLQKYIQYRKRKIFFGHGTILDLVDVIRKNKDEKFLLPVSDVHKEQIVEFLDELKINYTKGIFYKTVSADLSDIKNLNEFDVLVFFTPAGIKSLKQNFPNFRQGATRIAAFGHTAALTVKDLGYRLDIFAPNPQNPSMIGALEAYIREANKR